MHVLLYLCRMFLASVITLTRAELERHNVKNLAVQNNIAESPSWQTKHRKFHTLEI